jgi:heme ABC exporter ATP-binding subunit CcmA
MIRVKKLVKRFGPLTVLKELDFEVEKGEFVALLGPNGAGKTTLLRILASLSRPTSGLVQITSYRLPQDAPAVRSLLGVVSHQPLLYGDLTAEENLVFYSRLYNVDKSRIAEVLELVGLIKRADDLVRTFSRGMQQRLAIARAILHRPPLLLLDEPHTGLDQGAGEILDHLLVDVAKQGTTVVMTSHDLVRSSGLASRLDILSKGVISNSISKEEINSADLIQLYRRAIGGEGGQL